MNQIFLLTFVKLFLIHFILRLLWNSLDMVMQQACILEPGQVLKILIFFGLFALFILLFFVYN